MQRCQRRGEIKLKMRSAERDGERKWQESVASERNGGKRERCVCSQTKGDIIKSQSEKFQKKP